MHLFVGVKAEFLYDMNPKPKKQLDYANQNSVPLILWIGEEENTRGVYKLKNLAERSEVEIKHSELVSGVTAAIATIPAEN